MKNLFDFIRNNSSIFLFFILQSIALYLIFTKSTFHEVYASNTVDNVVGSLYETKFNITHYFSLNSENEKLRTENQQLRNLLKTSYIKSEADKITFQDTIFNQKFHHLVAKVVNITWDKPQNYITINRGSKDSIKVGMGVIASSGGMIGHIVRTSENFSVVKPIFSNKYRGIARVLKNDETGTLKWEWENQEIHFNDVPKHANVLKGDTVATIYSDERFPERTPIGIIDEVTLESGKASFEIKIDLLTDIKKLKTIYVIKDLYRTEQELIEEDLTDE